VEIEVAVRAAVLAGELVAVRARDEARELVVVELREPLGRDRVPDAQPSFFHRRGRA
jgi:hypothetical protein